MRVSTCSILLFDYNARSPLGKQQAAQIQACNENVSEHRQGRGELTCDGVAMVLLQWARVMGGGGPVTALLQNPCMEALSDQSLPVHLLLLLGT